MVAVPAQLLSSRARRDYDAASERRLALRNPRSPEEIAADQLRAFQIIWADATSDVPYYRALVGSSRAPAVIETWRDVQSIPTLTRQVLQDQAAQFVRRSGPPEGYAHTAGSTGTPLRIGMDQSERDLARVVKMAEWQEYGYRRQSKLFLIWGHQHLLGTGWRGTVNHYRRRLTDRLLGYRRANAYHLSQARSREIAEAMIAFRPVGLIGYAAALDLFARHTREFRSRFHELKLGFVLTTTEAPPREDTVQNIEDVFGCPVVQEYGGSEFGQVAFKRRSTPFSVYSDLYYLECGSPITTEADAYSAILTSLHRRYTPLIRYEIGDGIQQPVRLSSGHVVSFEGVAGRLTDTIALGGGDSIHSLSIFHCVHHETDVYNVQMRLNDDGIEVVLVTAPGADRAAIERRVRPRLIDVHPSLADVQFVYADDVQTSRAGKRRWCVDLRTNPPTCAASPAS